MTTQKTAVAGRYGATALILDQNSHGSNDPASTEGVYALGRRKLKWPNTKTYATTLVSLALTGCSGGAVAAVSSPCGRGGKLGLAALEQDHGRGS